MRVTKRDVLVHYALSEMSKGIGRERLEGFVNGLLESEIEYLAKTLSRVRRNAIENYVINQDRKWELIEFGAEEIAVTAINDEVNPLLERNGYNLDEIATDEGVCKHREFDAGGREVVDGRTIGVQNHSRVRIIDGMHRIIRMACDGRTRFEVYVGEKVR